jgi:hypothetical protein
MLHHWAQRVPCCWQAEVDLFLRVASSADEAHLAALKLAAASLAGALAAHIQGVLHAAAFLEEGQGLLRQSRAAGRGGQAVAVVKQAAADCAERNERRLAGGAAAGKWRGAAWLTIQAIATLPEIQVSKPTLQSLFASSSPVARQVLRPDLACSRVTTAPFSSPIVQLDVIDWCRGAQDWQMRGCQF